MASWLKLSRACCVSCATLPVWFTERLCRVWSRIPREQVDVRMLQWKAVLSIFLDVSELPLRDVPRMPHWRCGSGLAGGAFECLGFIHVIRWEKMVQPPVSCGRWFGWWNSWKDALGFGGWTFVWEESLFITNHEKPMKCIKYLVVVQAPNQWMNLKS